MFAKRGGLGAPPASDASEAHSLRRDPSGHPRGLNPTLSPSLSVGARADEERWGAALYAFMVARSLTDSHPAPRHGRPHKPTLHPLPLPYTSDSLPSACPIEVDAYLGALVGSSA